MTAMPDTPAATDPLRVQVRRTHEARGGYAVLQEALSKARVSFDEANAKLIGLVSQAASAVQTEERVLRELTLQRYEQTGDKRPSPGVGIRIVKKVDYDPATALSWAKANDLALVLDKKAFEKIATATAIPCAVVRDLPCAIIAEDLGEALELPKESI